MIYMRRTIFLLALIALTTASPSWAQRVDDEIDLQALYQQIDEAIDHYPQYVAIRQGQIADSQKKLLSETNLEQRFALAEQLYALYKPFRVDSALYYADLCIALADSLHRKDMVGFYLSHKALQFSNAGMYVESLELLNKVDKRVLDPKQLTKYYEAWMHVCGEMGQYAKQPDERSSYFDLQERYRDSVLAVAEKGSEEYLHLKLDVLSARQLYQDALDVSDRWISEAPDGTHEQAYAAFYRSMVYGKLSNGPMVRYWLGKSALDDIKCAVNDQASLFMLAERLSADGDHGRAYRYVRFCEDCNTTYSPQLRNYQVRYVASVMEAAYKNSQARYSRLLTIAAVGLLFFLVVVAILLVRLKRLKRKASR